MWQVWHDITADADKFLDTLTSEHLLTHLEQSINAFEDSAFGTVTKQMLEQNSVRSGESVGTRLLRTTYHYFFHTGEAHAVRQKLGHPDLPYFVGDMPDDLFLSTPQGQYSRVGLA
jgi:hypothetical protein